MWVRNGDRESTRERDGRFGFVVVGAEDGDGGRLRRAQKSSRLDEAYGVLQRRARLATRVELN